MHLERRFTYINIGDRSNVPSVLWRYDSSNLQTLYVQRMKMAVSKAASTMIKVIQNGICPPVSIYTVRFQCFDSPRVCTCRSIYSRASAIHIGRPCQL